jgi:hypothetical protein
LLLLLPGCTDDVGLDEQQRRRLSRMARLLYPHDALARIPLRHATASRCTTFPNLFVSDGSVFSTSGASNPTLTIVALAIRQAEHIAAGMSRREL